ncbi:hypothetical protein C8R43DRAFT_1122633 [Mycena crocata]|nr:hypothetical protein C8R43DRAFT_1122633 [Mycena crocata]
MSTPHPHVYVTYTPLESILQNDVDVELFPIESFDSLISAPAWLAFLGSIVRQQVVDLVSLLRPSCTQPAAGRIQAAMARAGCCEDPFGTEDLDMELLLRKLHSVWETAPPPDLVFFLGRSTKAPSTPSGEDESANTPPSTLFPIKFTRPWDAEWERPDLLCAESFPATFHIRVGTPAHVDNADVTHPRTLIFISGLLVAYNAQGNRSRPSNADQTDNRSTRNDAAFTHDVFTKYVLQEYIKTLIFRELVYVTRSQLFGINPTDTSGPFDIALEVEPQPRCWDSGYAALADRLAFGANISLYHSMIPDGDGGNSRKKNQQQYMPMDLTSLKSLYTLRDTPIKSGNTPTLDQLPPSTAYPLVTIVDQLICKTNMTPLFQNVLQPGSSHEILRARHLPPRSDYLVEGVLPMAPPPIVISTEVIKRGRCIVGPVSEKVVPNEVPLQGVEL